MDEENVFVEYHTCGEVKWNEVSWAEVTWDYMRAYDEMSLSNVSNWDKVRWHGMRYDETWMQNTETWYDGSLKIVDLGTIMLKMRINSTGTARTMNPLFKWSYWCKTSASATLQWLQILYEIFLLFKGMNIATVRKSEVTFGILKKIWGHVCLTKENLRSCLPY
jgi:hypothetical protein